MKAYKLLIIMLVATAIQVLGQEAKKPYHGYYVTVTRITVNHNKVRVIYGKDSKHSFTFACNAEEESCKAPQIDGRYQLLDDSVYTHKCDEYRMYSGRHGDWCTVCLQEVQ